MRLGTVGVVALLAMGLAACGGGQKAAPTLTRGSVPSTEAPTTTTTSAAPAAAPVTTPPPVRPTPTTRAAGSTQRPSPPPAAKGRIAFSSNRTGKDQIWVMNSDGSSPTQLTTAGGGDPAISPDGRRIAFGRSGHIFVMNADGSGQTQLTSSDSTMGDSTPTWSPNGAKIAFDRHNSVAYFDIVVMNADGSGQTLLTSGGCDETPAWSPDGTRIAFAECGGQITIINADGSDRRALPTRCGTNPDWRPDGKQLVYINAAGFSGDPSSCPSPGGPYLVDAAGTGSPTAIPNTSDAYMYPTPARWSPDGTQIAYDAQVGGTTSSPIVDIVVIKPDGSGKTHLTHASGTERDYVGSWR